MEGLRALDRLSDAAIALVTGGLSPASMALAMTDWVLYPAVAPGKQAQLAIDA